MAQKSTVESNINTVHNYCNRTVTFECTSCDSKFSSQKHMCTIHNINGSGQHRTKLVWDDWLVLFVLDNASDNCCLAAFVIVMFSWIVQCKPAVLMSALCHWMMESCAAAVASAMQAWHARMLHGMWLAHIESTKGIKLMMSGTPIIFVVSFSNQRSPAESFWNIGAMFCHQICFCKVLESSSIGLAYKVTGLVPFMNFEQPNATSGDACHDATCTLLPSHVTWQNCLAIQANLTCAGLACLLHEKQVACSV